MCGIFGVLNYSPSLIPTKTTELFHHFLRRRGPDSFNTFYSPSFIAGISRLAITDISHTSQPYINDETHTVTLFNGEIYNISYLTSLLQDHSISVTGSSEVEVLSKLHQCLGPLFVEYIDGIFSIAIYSKPTRNIYLYRDPHGTKPLYWSSTAKQFSFSSDAKSLSALLDQTKLSQSSFYEYLFHGYLSPYITHYKSVYSFPHSHYLHFHDSTITLNPYSSRISSTTQSLDSQLVDAIQSQLPSETSYGVLLSGGVDSSLLTALSVKSPHTPKPSCAITVAFTQKPTYETIQAYQVATDLGIPHVVLNSTPEDQFRSLSDFIPYLDNPISDTGAIGTYLSSLYCHQEGHKVLLSGTGADEIFYGYQRHLRPSYFTGQFLNTLPSPLRHVLDPILLLLRPTSIPISLPTQSYLYQSIACINPAEILSCLDFSLLPPYLFSKPFTPISTLSIRDRDLGCYLPNNLLLYTDAVTMYNSVECRVPFLSARINNFSKTSTSLRATKPELRSLVTSLLPNYKQPKKAGFNAGITTWPIDIFSRMLSCIEDHSSSLASFGFDTQFLPNPDRTPLTVTQRQLLYNLYIYVLWLSGQ